MRLPLRSGPLFIGLAILMGIAAIFLIMSTSNSGKKEKKAEPKVKKETIITTDVVVPMKTVLKGEMLNPDDLKVVKWPQSFLPENATFDSTAGLVGRVALQDMYPGEPIYEQKLAAVDTAGLPALIPGGLRAVSIKVSEIKGVAGFVKPGDKVDVLGTFNITKQIGDQKVTVKKTVTVLQDVLVLASAQSMINERKVQMETPEGILNGKAKTEEEVAEEEAAAEAAKDPKNKKKTSKKDKDEKKSAKDIAAAKKDALKKQKEEQKSKLEEQKRAKLVSSVTLGLTPQDAQIITVADESAELRLVLRGAGDTAINNIRGVEDEDVFGQSILGLTQPKTPSVPDNTPMNVNYNTVELIQGTEKQDLTF